MFKLNLIFYSDVEIYKGKLLRNLTLEIFFIKLYDRYNVQAKTQMTLGLTLYIHNLLI